MQATSGNVPTTQALRRHPVLYLATGDLVLSVDTSNSKTLFCVHKGVLSHHSVVFADMFALPSIVDVNDTYDGRPLVHLHDNCDEVEAFLNCLYNFGYVVEHPLHSLYQLLYRHCSRVPLKRLDPDTPLLVQGILKLSAKYQVDSIKAQIVQRLEDDWPTSALAWLRLCNDERLFNEDHMRYETLKIGEYAEDKFPEPASAIRLARDFDIPSILPAAYLKLLFADPTLDWDAIRNKEDTSHSRLSRSARWSLLDATDLRRLAQGRARLVTCLPQVHRAFMIRNEVCRGADGDDDGAPDCHTLVVRQHNAFAAARYSSFWTGVQEAEKPDPIQTLQGLRDAAEEWKLCTSCTELFRSKVAFEIKKLWDDLPRIFSLVPEER